MSNNVFDVVIVGAGITGLACAREIIRNDSARKILVIEKEVTTGVHASGRNSGVLHSGVFYSTSSMKAKLCSKSSSEIYKYCIENQLPANRLGKIVVPTDENSDKSLEVLLARGKANKTNVELIDRTQLKYIEPLAKSVSGRALYCPDTAVVSPKSILQKMSSDLKNSGVELSFGEECIDINSKLHKIQTNSRIINYGHLINCAGIYADTLAKKFGLAQDFDLLPFKGSYFEYDVERQYKPQTLIYPAPNLSVPFLGIHSVTDVTGKCYFGPSATPALGRENYTRLEGASAYDTMKISSALVRQFFSNSNNFRFYLYHEMANLTQSGFFNQIDKIINGAKKKGLKKSNKSGIRAQLYNKKSNNLEMDFIIERTGRSTHVLNAISPAFSCSFEFSKIIVEGVI